MECNSQLRVAHSPDYDIFGLPRGSGLPRPVGNARRVPVVQRPTIFRPRVAPRAIPAIDLAALLDKYNVVRMRRASNRTR